MKTAVTKATLPLSIKNKGDNTTSSINFLKSLGIAIQQENTTTADVIFPEGWQTEELSGQNIGWSIFQNKSTGKDFFVFKHPIKTSESHICIINCIEIYKQEKADVRTQKQPTDYDSQGTSKFPHVINE